MQSETLAQEFARLVKEYHEGDDHTKLEAWNLLADYTVDNADAISAALSAEQTQPVAESEWHRSDNSMGGVLLYTLREDGWRRGQPVMVNDVTVRIERCTGSETDIEPIAHLVHSALVEVPAAEPAAKRWLVEETLPSGTIKWEVVEHEHHARKIAAMYRNATVTPLYTSPPLSHQGEDSAEVIEEGARILAKWIGYAWDGLSERDISDEYKDWAYSGIGALSMQGGKPALRKVAASILAATRSGSASKASGGDHG